MSHLVAGDDMTAGPELRSTCFIRFHLSLLFILNSQEIGRGAGEVGLGVLCSLDCFLLFWGVNTFGDPKKLGCLPSPGKAGYFTCCPGSVGPYGAKEVLAASVRLDYLELAALHLFRMKIF